VPFREEVHPELTGPALDLDALEKADGEERGIHGHAVEAGRHIGDAI
jgi:hypothetical protein